jgi:two-component system chemotaxis response regulator CheY
VKSILIVEGNDSVAEMFAYLFAGRNWHVSWYSDGPLAREALAGRVHYDAVIVGYRLSGFNGVELIKEIRALDHRKHVPIVMVTGTVDAAVVAAAVAAGANNVLYKPADIDILVATVTKYVERRPGVRAPEDRPAKHPARLVTFLCPLCREVGRIVTLVAELDPEPPPLTVIDVQGDCAHARGFGQLDQLTIEQEWQMIEAALVAARNGPR